MRRRDTIGGILTRNVRHRRLHRSPRGGSDPDRRASSASSTAATTRPASPSSTTPATCSSRSGPASWSTSRRRSPIGRPHAAIGLAHTRWATHGRPNDLNAHPHQDCTGEITVIHNGIIENFRELRDGLEARGHTPHLRDRHRGASPTSSRRPTRATWPTPSGRPCASSRAPTPSSSCTAARATGSSAPARTCRSSSGCDGEESFLASDVAAILAHTDQVIFLEEGDVADIRPSGVTITDVDGAPRERTDDDHRLDARGRREGRLRALHAQGDPRAARVAAPGDRRPGRPRTDHIWLEELDGLRGDAPDDRPGRADRLRHAPSTRRSSGPRRSRTGSGIPARANVGSEFRYSPPPIDERTLVIAVTQSGETADTIAPTRLARERGCPVIAVTNTVGSGDHPRGRSRSCSCRPARRSRSPPRRRSSPRSRRW